MQRREEQYQDLLARLFPSEKQSAQNVTFQVTDDCNLRCTYCYQTHKGHHTMPFDVAKRFIDMLIENSEETKQYIDSYNSTGLIMEFIGGEPFLEVDLIDQIIDYFVEQLIIHDHPWQYNYRVSICSNGLNYFDDKVQDFIKRRINILSFNISIDGNKELHDSCRIQPNGEGSYDIAMAGVQHFREVFGGRMGSKMTLAPANISFTAAAVKSLIESGYDDINLNCVFEKGWDEGHATVLYYQLKEIADYLIDNDLYNNISLSIFTENFFRPKHLTDEQTWCGGLGKMISVDWKGDIFPCIRYMESSLGEDCPPVIVGNVYKGMCYSQEQKDCIQCMRAVTRLTESTEECINCSIAEGCAECSAYNYQDCGGHWNHRATYICVMHQARALANAYYYNKQFQKTGEPKRMKIWLEKEKALKIISEDEWNMLKDLEYPVGQETR